MTLATYQPGDAPLVTYRLVDPRTRLPVNGTVSCSITAPSGATTTPTPANPSTGTYEVVPTLTELGVWTIVFTSTGAIVDRQTVTLFVGDTDAPPAWAPTLDQVGAHIPTRTREIGVDNDYTGTFTDATEPTAAEVTVLIGHACAWVAGRVGDPVMPAAYPLLNAAAALRTAYWVELAYPERDADVTVYERLAEDAARAEDLASSVNRAAGGGGSLDEDGRAESLVAYSFPDPPAWADQTFL